MLSKIIKMKSTSISPVNYVSLIFLFIDFFMLSIIYISVSFTDSTNENENIIGNNLSNLSFYFSSSYYLDLLIEINFGAMNVSIYYSKNESIWLKKAVLGFYKISISKEVGFIKHIVEEIA